MINLKQITEGTPYAAYTYSYPHKTAYRKLDPARKLEDVWTVEKKDALFLYLHVPFCEMRCGFCNLFTTSNPKEEVANEYMAALWRQARHVSAALGSARVARMAIGGGTPTWLNPVHLDQLFQIADELFAVDGALVPISVETSPRTADLEKLRILCDHRVERISIGVQSLVEAEVHSSGRAQKNQWVEAAIDRIRKLSFPILNVDLIYGLPGQTVASWMHSLSLALQWEPEELYLYPLYVRPLTGLARWGRQAEDALRVECYHQAVQFLTHSGYKQSSMRMFSKLCKTAALNRDVADDGPLFCCQDDGMVGLGCGARSYTRALHYSSEYAVGATGVRQIISDYISRPEQLFDIADFGCELNEQEQRRRWVIKLLLRASGLNIREYELRFGTRLAHDLPELDLLKEAGFLQCQEGILLPTPAGLERSDAIGPWLSSNEMREQMDGYQLR